MWWLEDLNDQRGSRLYLTHLRSALAGRFESAVNQESASSPFLLSNGEENGREEGGKGFAQRHGAVGEERGVQLPSFDAVSSFLAYTPGP